MDAITGFFNINNTFFTLIGYQMSYLEFFGTIFSIWCVYLTARAKILSWPIGIIGTALYIFLFYQIQLYSDLFEQIYFLFTGFWGWWAWSRSRTNLGAGTDTRLKIGRNSFRSNAIYAGVIVVGTLMLTYIAKNLNVWLPAYFPEPASLPFLDAFTTIMSFVAQWLLAKKKLENWILWIVVDIIGVWLYWHKGVKFISMEYALFLIIAISGFIGWLKEHRGYNKQNGQTARPQI